jgi:hypothetical protein
MVALVAVRQFVERVVAKPERVVQLAHKTVVVAVVLPPVPLRLLILLAQLILVQVVVLKLSLGPLPILSALLPSPARPELRAQ